VKRAIYPGTFDPVTNGHLDVLNRAVQIFDEVIVTVAVNSSKSPMFSLAERMEMLETQVKKIGYKSVTVESFDGGLMIEYAVRKNATAIVRGLRQMSDFEYEFQIALMNRHLSDKVGKEISTVFLMPNEKYIYLTSSIVREVGKLGGDISYFVPEEVQQAFQKKLQT